MQQRIDRLESLLTTNAIALNNSDAGLAPSSGQDAADTDTGDIGHVSTAQGASPVALNLSCSLGAFPASSMISSGLLSAKLRSAGRPDLVRQGVVSEQTAEGYFTFYRQHLDPFMQYELADSDTLAILRGRSSLLATAICTVAASCTSSEDYQSCLTIFKAEVSRRLFEDKYDFDDVRALCIGALWLSDCSPALNGLGESPPCALYSQSEI